MIPSCFDPSVATSDIGRIHGQPRKDKKIRKDSAKDRSVLVMNGMHDYLQCLSQHGSSSS